jgi:hypothetical protein
VGAEQARVLAGRVPRGPGVSADLGALEPVGGVDLVAPAEHEVVGGGGMHRTGRRELGRRPAVGLGERRAKRTRRPVGAVPEHRERTAGDDRATGGGVASVGIGPVPRLGRDQQLEARRLDRPGLEVELDDGHVRKAGAGAPGHGGHLGARLERNHRVIASGEQAGRLAGAGTDLEDPLAGADPGVIEYIVDQRLRIRGPYPLVEIGHGAEAQPALARHPDRHWRLELERRATRAARRSRSAVAYTGSIWRWAISAGVEASRKLNAR